MNLPHVKKGLDKMKFSYLYNENFGYWYQNGSDVFEGQRTNSIGWSEHVEKDLKVGFVGNGTVGKTSTVMRMLGEDPVKYFKSNGYLPTVYRNRILKLVFNDQLFGLNLRDVEGMFESDESLANMYSKFDVIVFVFDITNPESLDYLLNFWTKPRDKNDETRFEILSKKVILLCGNKSDLRLEEEKEGGENIKAIKINRIFEVAEILNAQIYVETSANQGYNFVDLNKPPGRRTDYRNEGFGIVSAILHSFIMKEIFPPEKSSEGGQTLKGSKDCLIL